MVLVNMRLHTKHRRNVLELYYAILTSVNKESSYGQVKPTKIQFSSNMSYDRTIHYLDRLTNLGMLSDNNGLHLTEKGRNFLDEYGKIKEMIDKLHLEYI